MTTTTIKRTALSICGILCWIVRCVDLKRFGFMTFARILAVIIPFHIIAPSYAATYYVSTNGANTYPYTNWLMAARSVTVPLALCDADDTVIVNDGNYTVSSSIVLSNRLTLISANGPYKTTLMGAPANFHDSVIVMMSGNTDGNSVIDGFTISGGNTGGKGGGVYILNGGIIRNCIVSNNASYEYGGGIYANNGATIRNCLICDNTAGDQGGGINVDGRLATVYIQNCTIVKNTADGAGRGGGIAADGLCTVENSIVAYNIGLYTHVPSLSQYYENAAYLGLLFSHSFTSPEPRAGTDNIISSNPHFVDWLYGDFHIQSSSPCRNTGANQSWMSPAQDLDGNTRIAETIVDMGAFEYIPPPLPGVPSGVAASQGAYTDKVVVTWQSSTNATAYNLYRNTSNYYSTATNIATTSNLAYQDFAGEQGRIYFYWVDARNDNGTSGISSSAWGFRHLPLPGVPSSIAASKGAFTNIVVVSWQSATNAATYNVYRSISNQYSTSTYLSTTNSLTCSDNSVEQGRPYFYWIRATNLAGMSSASTSAWGYSSLSPPSGVGASRSGWVDRIKVRWDLVQNANEYRIWRSTQSNLTSAVLLGDYAAASYVDHDVAQGVKYFYALQSLCDISTSSYSSIDYGYTSLPAPTTIVASDAGYTDKVFVSWSGVSNATGYEIWRSTNDITSTASHIASSGSSTNYYDNSVVKWKLYYYWIIATNSLVESAFGDSDSGYAGVAGPPPIPVGVSASQGVYTDKVTVSWQNSVDATAYNVFRNSSNYYATATNLATTSCLTHSDNSVEQGRPYFYWIRATNLAGMSSASTSACGYSSLSPPSGVGVSKAGWINRIKIKWDAVINATGYNLWRSSASNLASPTLIGIIGASPYVDHSVSEGVAYYYGLQSVCDISTSTYSSIDCGYTLLSTPASIIASDGTFTDKVSVSWNSVPSATGYEVWRGIDDEFSSSLLIGGTTSNTTYDDRTLVTPDIFYYWIVATNSVSASLPTVSDPGFSDIVVPIIQDHGKPYKFMIMGSNVTVIGLQNGTRCLIQQSVSLLSPNWTKYGSVIVTNFIFTIPTNIFQMGSNQRIFRLAGTPDTNVASGLVAYYPFNGSANDESGNGYTSVVYGATMGTNRFGQSGDSYYFNGSSHIETGVSLEITNTPISVSLWLKFPGTGNGKSPMGLFGPSGSTRGNFFFCRGGTNQLYLSALGGSGSIALSASLTLNQWHHIVGVAQSSPIVIHRLYVDGVAYDGGFEGSASSFAQFFIGGLNLDGSAGNLWYGNIDDVRIYNRVLTSNDVWKLMQLPN